MRPLRVEEAVREVGTLADATHLTMPQNKPATPPPAPIAAGRAEALAEARNAMAIAAVITAAAAGSVANPINKAAYFYCLDRERSRMAAAPPAATTGERRGDCSTAARPGEATRGERARAGKFPPPAPGGALGAPIS